MAQGFVKSLNLFESQDGQSARGILNNLGGGSIASDIQLFANNLRTFNFVNFTNYVASEEAYPTETETFYLNVNPELTTDGDFDGSPALAWNEQDANLDLIDVVISAGVATITTSSQSVEPPDAFTTGGGIYQHVNVTAGQSYTIEINRTTYETGANGIGSCAVKVYDAPGFTNLNISQTVNNGFNSFTFTPNAATVTLALAVWGGDVKLDDISVKLTNTQVASDYSYIVIPTTEVGKVPFATGNRIYLTANDGTRRDYEVVDSNALDRFRLKRVLNGVVQPNVSTWDEFNGLANKVFYIDAPVTYQNLNSFSLARVELNDGSGGRGEATGAGGGEGADLDSLDAETSSNNPPVNTVTFLKSGSIADYSEDIDSAVDTFYYKEARSIVAYKNNYFDRLFEVNGAVYIANDSEIQYDDTTKNTMPGLFIVAHGEAVRAFSDTNNPWGVNASEPLSPSHAADPTDTLIDVIQTENSEEDASVLNLIFNGPAPTIYSSNANAVRTTAASSVNVQSTWTHKLPVTVNGEPFFLLMTDNEGIFSTP